jgi:hypothetical protein
LVVASLWLLPVERPIGRVKFAPAGERQLRRRTEFWDCGWPANVANDGTGRCNAAHGRLPVRHESRTFGLAGTHKHENSFDKRTRRTKIESKFKKSAPGQPYGTPSPNPAAVSVLSILKSNEFREAYHQALNLADKTPEAQQAIARKIIEGYFRLEEIAPNTPLNSDSFYFTEKPVEVAGNYKFLVPGTIKRGLIAGTLFLLTLKSASVERLVEAKEFDGAVSAVEAVRLTLVPERVNGIVAFISDAKKFYANNDASGAEKAIGTALDHLNRAATEGLGRIKTEAEKGKRSNEVAGTRRTLANLRRKLRTEITDRAEASRIA